VSAASRDGRTILLGGEHFFGLDEVGADIWPHVEHARTLPEIAASLATVYDASAERLEADVRRFLAEMRACGLVIPAERSR
jgi:hypothetical protein